ncbi:MAG: hypothetical protein PWQ72_729 [Pseudothermotoga sp.]|nr:hypothetical protein [Pseudothermotoga sp.]MDK2883521.1 hypothetical protein [Pseudothermotoga sp.]
MCVYKAYIINSQLIKYKILLSNFFGGDEMYLAITLIIAGFCLVFFGAKFFFGILFAAFGIYILVSLLSVYKKAQKRAEQNKKNIEERFRGKLDQEDIEWLKDMITPPIGRKFLIMVNEENSTNVKISIPLSIVIVLKPFLKALSPMLRKSIKDKISIEIEEKYYTLIEDMIITSLDELMSFSGDFIKVESKGTTVRVGIV